MYIEYINTGRMVLVCTCTEGGGGIIFFFLLFVIVENITDAIVLDSRIAEDVNTN